MGLLELLIIILVILWIIGFAVNVGGGFIHLLLLVALVILIIRLLRGRTVV
jgi:hypothetical protein